MARHLVCPDVSEFQRPLNHTYTRDFVIFRVMFGSDYLDPNFLANAAAVKRLHGDGRIAGCLLYTVYTDDPVRAQFEAVWNAIGPHIPPWLTGIMIDVETWRGKSYELSGNHSRRINHLYGLHAHRMGSFDSVIAYGNQGDLQELYPGRDRRCKVIVASYGSSLSFRKVHGAIGQQYSDGQQKYAVPRLNGRRLPRKSDPFGHCDHNVFPGIANGKELVRLLRPEQLAPQTARPKTKVKPAKAKVHLPAHHSPAHPAAHPATHPATHPAGHLAPAAAHPAAHPAQPAVAHATVTAPKDTVRVISTATSARNALVSPNGAHSLVLRDDGSLEIRHRINPDILTTKER